MKAFLSWVLTLFTKNNINKKEHDDTLPDPMVEVKDSDFNQVIIPVVEPEGNAPVRKVENMKEFVGITSDCLQKVFKLPAASADIFAPAFWDACQKNGINTPARVAAFLANVGQESAGLTRFVENLNYSAVGLSRTWPNRYAMRGTNGALLPGMPNQLAKSLGGNPKAIANATYANRMGNGAPTTNDGWNFRGRTPMMITGKAAYAKAAAKYNIDFVTYPEKMEDPIIGIMLAADFWAENNINKFADAGDFDGCCDCVNIGKKTEKDGDAIGYAPRKVYYNALIEYFKQVAAA